MYTLISVRLGINLLSYVIVNYDQEGALIDFIKSCSGDPDIIIDECESRFDCCFFSDVTNSYDPFNYMGQLVFYKDLKCVLPRYSRKYKDRSAGDVKPSYVYVFDTDAEISAVWGANRHDPNDPDIDMRVVERLSFWSKNRRYNGEGVVFVYLA